MISSRTITATYAQFADEFDRKLGMRNANWFHFATWGTYTVGNVIEAAGDTPMGRALLRAENRIFHNVINRRTLYRLAMQIPGEADWLIYNDTVAIARYEQRLIDDDLKEAFKGGDAEWLTAQLYVQFPNEKLYLGQDVPGHPGTAVTDWRVYDDRIKWIEASIQARQQEPSLHQHPFPVQHELGYHAILGTAS